METTEIMCRIRNSRDFWPSMARLSLHFPLIVIVLAFMTLMSQSYNLSCDSNDLAGLNSFRKCVGSAVDGWGSPISDCCYWARVTCDNSTATKRRVIGLDLSSRRLVGELCESLEGLDQLKILNLSHNDLYGILPSKLFQLQKLEVLDLTGNKFAGSLSVPIHLPRLRIFSVSDNDLGGPITTTICDTSPLTESLNFANNHFIGELPNFGNCTSLQNLFLGSNNLRGSLPVSLFQLRYLHQLQLQDNSFSGPIPRRIGNLSNIVKMDLSSNMFSGVLPDIFGGLSRLEDFFAWSNNLFGNLPSSMMSSPSLSRLDFSDNILDGHINISCSAMVRLTSLSLYSNSFQGPLPECLSSCHRLKVLCLSNNSLSGEIPSSFKELQALTCLSLDMTNISNLSSALQVLQQCRNLSVLAFAQSFRDEEMPGQVDLLFPNLQAFIIANSQLQGSIPSWLSRCEQLQLLGLPGNRLNGTIPNWIGNFKSLFYLNLGDNSFFGEIPKSLTELRSLVNQTMPFPSSGFSSSMRATLRFRDGRSLTYRNVWRFPSTIDLSYNKLTGPIWSSFGNLKGLQSFYLGHNELSGNIPSNLSGMVSLEELDLSFNNLTGQLPSSLTELTFLSHFDVSFNSLSGPIPSRGQFSTFPDSSFEGNTDLCGLPSLRSCQRAQPSVEVEPIEKPTKNGSSEGIFTDLEMPFSIGVAVGFAVAVNFCFLSGWVLGKSQHTRKRRTSS